MVNRSLKDHKKACHIAHSTVLLKMNVVAHKKLKCSLQCAKMSIINLLNALVYALSLLFITLLHLLSVSFMLLLCLADIFNLVVVCYDWLVSDYINISYINVWCLVFHNVKFTLFNH